MTTITASLKKANFGTDGPTIVRNLFLLSLLSALGIVAAYFIKTPILFWIIFIQSVLSSATFALTGIWMLYSSWVFKPYYLSGLIDDLELKGDEVILDMGCGRGIFLCKAAKHITTGRVYGIDLWLSRDQSNNSEEATWNNAEALGVRDRIDLQTADMCDIPFADDKFDVIISNLAIHNIPTEEGRTLALQEMLRTLRPGGRFAISDILQGKQYAKFFAMQENVEFEISKPYYRACPPVTVITGTKTK